MKAIRDWLIRWLGGTPKAPCKHEWYVMIECYPRFTHDYWSCRKCGFTKAYPNDEPPEPLKTEVCNLGDVHIVNGRVSG